MKASEVIRAMVKSRGLNVKRLSEMMGVKQQIVDQKLHNGDLKVGFLAECAEALGYEVVIQPKSAGKRKEGSYVVTVEKEENGKWGKE